MSDTPIISILTTGGTIASTYDAGSGAFKVSLDADQLLAGVARDGLPRLEARNVLSKTSFSLTFDDALAIVRAIAAERARPEVAGVVVAHGTDTMEETSFLADLLLAPGKPVVFTGAQIPGGESGGDGPRNLADAIRVAAEPRAEGLGAFIVFDGDILPARDAAKRHSTALRAFEAPGLGPIGKVELGEVHLLRRPASFPRFETDRLAEPVDLVMLSLGGGARPLRLAADAGSRGIVLAATGRGNAGQEICGFVAELTARSIPVVITTRCGEGRVSPFYGNGGGVDLKAAGAIFASDLAPTKARMLLALVLAQPGPPDVAAAIASVADAGLSAG